MLFDATKTIDFVGMIRSIRKDRRLAVETCEQYRFAHVTIFEYAEKFLELSHDFDWNKL